MRCFVPTCANKSDKRRLRGVTFHKIPESLKEEWLLAINRHDLGGDHRICSQHFKETDFFLGNRKFLKPNIVPTLQLPRPFEIVICDTTQTGININGGGEADEFRGKQIQLPTEKALTEIKELEATSSSEILASPSVIKLDHNYSRSIESLKEQLAHQTKMVNFYKSKYTSEKRTSIRRKEEIKRLKEILFQLKKDYMDK